MKPHLISFKICPFVQRSVILMQEKGVDYDITYINPKEPPEWFKKKSPLGKVPLLEIGDEVLFESAVIVEYLDEINPPSLHPSDALAKAKNRAWIEFASTLIMSQMHMVMAKEQEDFDKAKEELCNKLATIEKQVTAPYFNGEDFSLVDIAFAPIFMRLGFLEKWQPMGLLETLPKTRAWAERLLARPSVIHSVVDDLEELYRQHIAGSGGYGAKQFAGK